MDERFEQVNNRFGDMLDFFYILTGIFVALSVANITLRLKACADLICSRRHSKPPSRSTARKPCRASLSFHV